MIEYLELLVEDGDYNKGLSYAEQLLLNNECSPSGLVAIHCSILRCRYYLNEYYGALMSGKLVLRLAEELGEWDYFGTACLYVGSVLDRLGQPEAARTHCYDYLANTHKFGRALRHQTMIWSNLGIYHTQLGDGPEAVRALTRALDLATAAGNARHAHGIRHGLIQAFIKFGTFTEVPALLAKCLHYLRHETNSPDHRDSLLFHFKLRAEFALLTNRPDRALAVARRGLHYAAERPDHLFNLHMVCARVCLYTGNSTDAVMHSLAARVSAIQVRRFELEALAAEFMYECTKIDGEFAGDRANEYTIPGLVGLSSHPRDVW